jgi:hypothetical protein
MPVLADLMILAAAALTAASRVPDQALAGLSKTFSIAIRSATGIPTQGRHEAVEECIAGGPQA